MPSSSVSGHQSLNLIDEASSCSLKKHKYNMINLSHTNNHFEIGMSSLLIEPQNKPTPLFGGDRLIPCRPQDTHFDGAEQYRHEEALLLAEMRPKKKRRNRRSNNQESSDEESISSNRSASSEGSSHSSHDSDSSSGSRAARQRQQVYANLI